mmetsp:Transcript_13866/g.25039  ORF Transcript_13866/g.25039 Transcript_13866/m.25039 type:complete len:313 (+) Transcript_13866:84-1022(+)
MRASSWSFISMLRKKDCCDVNIIEHIMTTMRIPSAAECTRHITARMTNHRTSLNKSVAGDLQRMMSKTSRRPSRVGSSRKSDQNDHSHQPARKSTMPSAGSTRAMPRNRFICKLSHSWLIEIKSKCLPASRCELCLLHHNAQDHAPMTSEIKRTSRTTRRLCRPFTSLRMNEASVLRASHSLQASRTSRKTSQRPAFRKRLNSARTRASSCRASALVHSGVACCLSSASDCIKGISIGRNAPTNLLRQSLWRPKTPEYHDRLFAVAQSSVADSEVAMLLPPVYESMGTAQKAPRGSAERRQALARELQWRET